MTKPLTPAEQQVQRGNHVVYRDGETNRCPGCGRSHWIVGRVLAECAFCGTALELQDRTLMARRIEKRNEG